MFERALEVEATPHGESGAASTGEEGLRGTADGAPAGLVAAHLNDGQIVPHVVHDKAIGVCATEGAIAEVLEQLNAHEGTIGIGEVNVFEDHRVVPVLAVSRPEVAAAVGHGLAGPHEIPLVEVIRGNVGAVVAVGVAGGPDRTVGLQVPVGVAVDVLFVRPCATRAASRGVLWTVPIVGVDRGVGRTGFVDDLEFDVHRGRTRVEGVHAGVGHGDVDLTAAFTGHAKPSVDRVHGQASDGQILVVHFNHGDGVVLAFPTEVVHPAAEVVGGVSDRDVRCG